MEHHLSTLITLAGIGHLGVLVAAALVPSRLRWREALRPLPRLHRQMYIVYGVYIALSIAGFAAISIVHARELASGSGLARAVCACIAAFWGLRLALQWVFDVEEYLTTTWLRLGYHALTALFAGFTLVYGAAALWPAR
jgi:hypothetical protein